MKYTIIIEDSANADLRQSYEWGVRVWGKAQAQAWFRHTIGEMKALASLPKRCPIAPDTEEFDETIRQLVVGRYRILFTIRGQKVHILHVRGAYFDEETEEEEA